MTYGRARLWLGVAGVGSLITIASIVLTLQVPQMLLEVNPRFGTSEFLQLVAVFGLFLLWLMPLDFLGGFLIPRKFGKSNESFGDWVRSYTSAALFQATLFVFFGSTIILLSLTLGLSGGLIAVSLLMFACFFVRNSWVINRVVTSETSQTKLLEALALIHTWQIFVPQTLIVEHRDMGFTGGVVGLGSNTKIVIPEAWISFNKTELATAIARRALAVNTGSYSRGLIVAFVSNLAGFLLCSFLSGANLVSVAGLVTTMCGFTLWSFFGLLILPTVSRNASLKIDQELAELGLPFELISNTASAMDHLQDNEPARPWFIETIFHPVPSVNGRNRSKVVTGLAAWNVARTTLFFSWACLGILSRSVHCNVGRPELWTMLPTD